MTFVGARLDAADLAWAVGQWLPEGVDDPRVNLLTVPDLGGMPAALIVTAEHDPLRDEGDAFAAALAAAGTPVHHRREPGMVHGFLQGLDLVSPAAAAASERFFADARVLLRVQEPPEVVTTYGRSAGRRRSVGPPPVTTLGSALALATGARARGDRLARLLGRAARSTSG